MTQTGDPLRHLRVAERRCVRRFLDLLEEAFDDLRQVWLFGSFARGDAWGPHMPMNSDIDLLVVTVREVTAEAREALVNETYPLYLECGRQISPQFWSAAKFDDPPTETARTFKEQLLREGAVLVPAARRR